MDNIVKMLKEDYNFEICDSKDYEFARMVTLECVDAYEKEMVTLWCDYNTSEIEATIDYINLDREVLTSEVCGQHHGLQDCEECSYFRNGKCVVDEEAEKTMNEWEDSPTLKVSNISISREVYSEKCYLQIPHTHYYLSYTITVKPCYTEKLRAILELIDVLIELYELTLQ